MKHIRLRVLFATLFAGVSLISACKDDNQTLFSSNIANDRGSLQVLNPTSFLGSAIPGESFDESITVYSAGGLKLTGLSATLTPSAAITFAGGSYPGTGGTCGTELESGQTCTVVLHFQPTTIASHSATLDFFFNDSLGAATLSYIVYADSHPILQFEYGSSYDFGNRFLGTATNLRIRVSNIGRVNAEGISLNNLSAPFAFRGGSYPGTGGTCGSRLTAGSSCELYITYSPSTKGQHLQDITFSYLNTSRTESNTLNLLAWGFEEAILSLSDSSGIDYGVIAAGYNFNKTLTVTYVSGDVDATFLAISGISAPFSEISGGDCLGSLSKTKGSCTILVKVNSATSGTWLQNLTLSYNSGPQTRTITRTIKAITKQKASLTFSPTGTVDFGTVANSSTKNQTFTITYAGGELPATLIGFSSLSAPFNYAGGTFPGGGTCSSTLSTGSCTVIMRFSPTTMGSYSQSSKTFSYNDGYSSNASPVINFTGKTESQLSWASTAPFAFGDVVSSLSKTNTLTLTIPSGATASLSSSPPLTSPFSYTTTGNYPGSGGTCGSPFSGTSCTLKVTFSPPSVGTFTDTLTLNYNDGLVARTLTASLSGNGKSPAILTMPDTDFGSVPINSSLVKTITITNSSTMSATSISSNPTVPSGFTYRAAGSTCTTTLTAGSSCVMAFVFSPTLAQAYSGTVAISYNDGTGTKNLTATLSGTGTLSSDIYISGLDTYDFGSTYTGQTKTLTVTLSHGGSSTPASITSKTMSLASDYTITSDTCPSSLVNGQSCTFTLNFSPTSATTRNNTFTVAYNNGTNKTATRLYTGTGISSTLISFTAATYDFGSQTTDSTYEATLTVNRSGPIPLSASTTITGTGFTYSGAGTFPGGGNCDSTFINGCTIKVKFSPTSTVSYSGKLEITYNNGYTSGVKASINLSGTGLATGTLTYASSSTAFGSTIQSTTVTRTITVNHSGTGPATSLSASSLSAPFSYKGGSYPGTGGSCGTSLSSSGSCTIVVSYSPTSVGTHTANLTLSYNNGSSAKSITNNLSGTAVSQAILGKSPNSPYSFGSTPVGIGVDKTITLSNAGGTPATNIGATFSNSVFSFKNGTFPGTGGTCTTSLASSSSCTIVLQFKPTASTAYSGIMTFNYDDGLRTQTELIDLTGN